MSPRSMTTVPRALPSLGQVAMKPAPQWSQCPGSSLKPYSQRIGYSPRSTVRSVPASDVAVMVDAPLRHASAAFTRRLSSRVGIRRMSVSGGSTA